MSLIRLLVLAGVVLALVPADREARDAFFARVNEQVSWALSACERNPESCDHLQQASREVMAKLQHGAAIVLHHTWLSFSNTESSSPTLSVPAARLPAAEEVSPGQEPVTANELPENTLTRADLRIDWSAPRQAGSAGRVTAE